MCATGVLSRTESLHQALNISHIFNSHTVNDGKCGSILTYPFPFSPVKHILQSALLQKPLLSKMGTVIPVHGLEQQAALYGAVWPSSAQFPS